MPPTEQQQPPPPQQQQPAESEQTVRPPPQQLEHAVQYPAQSLEIDSAFDEESDVESSTTSLRSSISNFTYENGRRYHAYKAGQYWGPNDETQSDQLDIAHHIFTMLMGGKLYSAPLDDPKRALDVGTGTGLWALDFADSHPDCQTIGTDLSPTQPREVPPNLQFEVDDACSEWTYTKNSFDFVHVRSLYGSVKDWPAFYREVFKHLKPGGWIEQMEFGVVPQSDDNSVPPGHIFEQWGKISLEAGDAFEKSLRVVDEMAGNIRAAGFENVTEVRHKVPIGPWSKDPRWKEIGAYNRMQWETGIEGWCMFLLTNYLGWKYEEVSVYVADMRKALRDKSVHSWHSCAVVYAQKPLS